MQEENTEQLQCTKKPFFQTCSRRVCYYSCAFQKLEDGQNTWNWAAFFFTYSWMIYRKMYAYALLDFVITIVLSVITLSFSGIISFIVFLVWYYLHGYYGNALYYRVVKQRTAEGYCCIDGYSSTSLSLLIIELLSCIFVFSTPIAIGVFYLTDWFMNRRYHLVHKKDEDFVVNEQNIIRYLSQNQISPLLLIPILVSIILICSLAAIIVTTMGDYIMKIVSTNAWLTIH